MDLTLAGLKPTTNFNFIPAFRPHGIHCCGEDPFTKLFQQTTTPLSIHENSP